MLVKTALTKLDASCYAECAYCCFYYIFLPALVMESV